MERELGSQAKRTRGAITASLSKNGSIRGRPGETDVENRFISDPTVCTEPVQHRPVATQRTRRSALPLVRLAKTPSCTPTRTPNAFGWRAGEPRSPAQRSCAVKPPHRETAFIGIFCERRRGILWKNRPPRSGHSRVRGFAGVRPHRRPAATCEPV